jgi:hypothetical protein
VHGHGLKDAPIVFRRNLLKIKFSKITLAKLVQRTVLSIGTRLYVSERYDVVIVLLEGRVGELLNKMRISLRQRHNQL